MSLIHLARQGFITKSALPNVTRQRGTTTGTANLMLYGAGKNYAIGTNTTFTDSSTNNFTVTRNGDTIQATNNPFTGSVYFDGTDDYLSVANNTALQPGTGTFTIECWIYRNVAGANHTIYAKGGATTGFQFRVTSADVLRFTDGAAIIDSTTTIPALTWTHIAIVRSSTGVNGLTMYINGVQSGQGTVSTDFNQTEEVRVGTNRVGADDFNGYISCLRFVKGTAVYTANFTPPTSPLTAITNTQLLLLTAQQAPFRDSSSNNFTVTANGNAAGSGLEPFPVNYAGSGYFDGTGDYLSVANSTNLDLPADFTVEAWIYLTSTANNQNTIIGKWDTNSYAWLLNANPSTGALGFSIGNSGAYVTGINFGTSITANTWHHVAVIRTGSTIRAFVNGTQVGSDQTNTSNLTATATTFIGKDDSALRNFNGYISNVRVIKGTAQYTAAFTPPAAPLTAVTNTSLLLLTNNVGPFVDTSANGFPVLRNGDAVQTGFSPFTGQPSAGSAYFDGTGDYLSVANNTAFDFGSGNLTIEQWVYPTSLGAERIISSQWFGGTISQTAWTIDFQATNKIRVLIGSGSSTQVTINSTSTFSANNWYHVAVVRSGTTITLYVNGVNEGSVTLSGVINNIAYPIYIGALNNSGVLTSPFVGYISNVRIVKGTALYTSNFTPATAPLPAVTNTSLLLNTDNYTIANSTPTYLPVTVNGNTTISTAQYPTGMNRSIYFDGTGDYLRTSNNAALNVSSGDFTIEFFVYFDSVTAGRIVISNYVSTSPVLGIAIYTTSLGVLHYYLSSNGVTWNLANGVLIGNIVTGTWYHVVLVRNGSVFTPYFNGVAGTTTTTASSLTNIDFFVIGGDGSANANAGLQGYLSNVRIVKGAALYTANFTPPAAPLPLSVTVPAFVTNNIYGVYQLA